MLPTLAVVFWAYGMYALFSFVLQRKDNHVRGRSRWGRFTRLTLLATATAGVGLILWSWTASDKHNQRLKLAGFLGTVYAEGWPHGVNVDRMDYPPVRGQVIGPGGQPVYTLLHPETPASQVEPEKKLPKPRPSRAVQAKKAPKASTKAGKSAKVTKVPIPPSKKDKAAAKSRAQKKKRTSATTGARAHAG